MNNLFPAISVLVLAYNQRELLDRAVASVFAQECPPIEIVLSDDASSDGSFERMQELAAAYQGPHHVRVRRSDVNLGIGEHYNQLVAEARGELLVTAAGDDVSTPDRVARIAAAWEATERRADLIASHVIDLDHQGELHDVIRVDDLSRWRALDDWIARRPYIIGAGHAFTRRMMQHFGPMMKTIAYEDQIMVFRALCMGGAVTVDAPLVHYRRGGTSGRPTFDNAQHEKAWIERQRNRVGAELQQLVADADVAGCGDRVRGALDAPLRRDRYLRVLDRHPPWPELWQALLDAAPLPLGWRLRKALHAVFPNATLGAKSLLKRARRSDRRTRRADKGDRPHA